MIRKIRAFFWYQNLIFDGEKCCIEKVIGSHTFNVGPLSIQLFQVAISEANCATYRYSIDTLTHFQDAKYIELCLLKLQQNRLHYITSRPLRITSYFIIVYFVVSISTNSWKKYLFWTETWVFHSSYRQLKPVQSLFPIVFFTIEIVYRYAVLRGSIGFSLV